MSPTSSRKTNKYGFQTREPKPDASTTKKRKPKAAPRREPQLHSRTKVRKPVASSMRKKGVKPREKNNGPEGTEELPIVIEDNGFHIKMEGGVCIKEEETVLGSKETPIKVEEHDQRPSRGYATFTSIQRLNHDIKQRELVAAEQNRKWKPRDAGVPSSDDAAPEEEETVIEENTDIDSDTDLDEEDESWIDYDGEWAARASSESPYPDDQDPNANSRLLSSPPAFRNPYMLDPNTLAPTSLLRFEKTFRLIVSGRGYDKAIDVIKSINHWLSPGVCNFEDTAGMYGLRQLEKKGEIRIQGDTVFWPEAYERMEPDIKVEPEAEEVVKQASTPPLELRIRPLSSPLARPARHVSHQQPQMPSQVVDLGSPSPSPPPSPVLHSSAAQEDSSAEAFHRGSLVPESFAQKSTNCASYVDIPRSRFAEFRSILGRLITGSLFEEDGCASFESILEAVNEVSSVEFSVREADIALDALSESNALMYTGGEVYRL